MNDEQIQSFLDEIEDSFHTLKRQVEISVKQVDDEGFFAILDNGSNSIAVIIKHLAGNMISRWADFLTTDGETPDRHRDQEFILTPSDTRQYLMARWETGWRLVFGAVSSISSINFSTTVYIRGEAHSVVRACHRQMTHYAYHVGQIVQLSRYHTGDNWKTLSIPRGQSETFNETLRQKQMKRKNLYDKG